ncbi:MAG: hypothetical protein H0U92_12675 [Actinobacteria bacterium]|nr:hypothetical protein [Actinomycetota bacterium]
MQLAENTQHKHTGRLVVFDDLGASHAPVIVPGDDSGADRTNRAGRGSASVRSDEVVANDPVEIDGELAFHESSFPNSRVGPVPVEP